MPVPAPALTCRKCGAPLASGAASGFCARCLFAPVALPLTASPDSKRTIPVPKAGAEQKQFGGYELISQIARGGMGVVYKARDRANRIVALKMVLSGHFASEAERKRFRTESEAIASLDHPNIVPVYEVGELEGHPFFTMKLIEGGSLGERGVGIGPERRPGFSPRQSATIVARVARAIHHAHQRGVLHRDLKPGNILLDEKSEPYVTDFGIARRLENDSDLTRTGAVMGTPNYMSPEQAAGRSRQVTTATDIYSLGAILYHLLTGRPPFETDSPMETLRQVLEKEPDRPSSMNVAADSDLETICLKCLEKDPLNRYASAAALADDLERWLRDETIIARRSTTAERVVKWVRRKPVIAGLVGLVALACFAGMGGILWQWREAEEARKVAVANGNAEANARRLAQGHRDAAEQAYRQTAAMLSGIELEKAGNLLHQGNSAAGLAWFARVLRREPTNLVAASRIMSFLRRRAIALPEVLAPPAEERLMTSSLSLDQQRVVFTADQDEANVRIINLREGLPSVPGFTHVFERRVLGQIDALGEPRTTGRESGMRRGPGMVPPGMRPGMGPGMGPPGGGPGGGGIPIMRPPGMTPLSSGARHEAGDSMPITVGATRTPPLMNFSPVSASFSPDGKLVVTHANTGKIRIWDANTGAPLTPFLEHEGTIADVSISPDGRTLFTAGRSGVARAWDIATAKESRRFEFDGITTMAQFSPDSSRVITGNRGGVINAYDVQTGQAVISPVNCRGAVQSAEWSPDGQTVVAAAGTTAHVLFLSENAPVPRQFQHPAAITISVLTRDGRTLLTGCADQMARLWDTRTGEPLTEPLPHPEVVQAGALSHDGRRAATLARDNAVRIWNAATGQLLCEPLQQLGPALSLHFTGDDRGLIVLGRDGSVLRYTVSTPPPVAQSLAAAAEAAGGVTNLGRITSSCFSPDGRWLLTGGSEGIARLWEVGTGAPLPQSFSHGYRIADLAFSPDGTRILTAGTDSTVQIWDVKSGQADGKRLRHNAAIFSARFSADGKRVTALTSVGLGRIWDARTGEPLSPEHNAVLSSSSTLSPTEDKVVVVLGPGRAAALFDLNEGGMVGPIMKHSDFLGRCGFSPDGRKVITTSGDNTARIWDAATAKALTGSLRHGGAVSFAAFSPDGRQAVTVSQDRAARLWDATDGAALTHTLEHPGPVRFAEFSQDSRHLLTICSDHSVHLWDTRLGQRLVDPLPHATNVLSAHLSPDGQTVFTAAEDGTAQLWRMPVLPLPAPAWLPQLAEIIGGQRIDANGLTQPAPREKLAELRTALRAVTETNAYTRQAARLFQEVKNSARK